MFELSITQFSVLDTLVVKLHLSIAQYEFLIIFIRQYFCNSTIFDRKYIIGERRRKVLKYFYVYMRHIVSYEGGKHGSNSKKD